MTQFKEVKTFAQERYKCPHCSTNLQYMKDDEKKTHVQCSNCFRDFKVVR